MNKKWILVANEEQCKIFQKSPSTRLSYVCAVRENQEFVQTVAKFINENRDRFEFLSIIFPKQQIKDLHGYLTKDVLAKLTKDVDDFF